MRKDIVIIHYNTPRLTECLVMSVNKFVDGASIHIFDNSDTSPFTTKFDNVTVIDNTKGQIIDFEKWLDKYPNRKHSFGKNNNFASAKHAYSVEKCMELFPNGFLLIDSDVLLKKDISELFIEDCIYVSEVLTQPDGKTKRVCPWLCFINSRMCKKFGIHFFDENMMHGLCVSPKGDGFDTGAAFYYLTSELKSKIINVNEWCVHYGHGSWTNKRNISTDGWLEANQNLWK